ncbi:MAG TPA: hypothetical protein PLE28_02865 [bacterium]|nr:hypothetical protein [bacterium]
MKNDSKNPKKGLFLEAQKLVNNQYSIRKMEIMGQTDKKNLEIENFKKKLEKYQDIKDKSDKEIYDIARNIVLSKIRQGIPPLLQ